MSWHSIPVQSKELCIRTTLRCGQSFRWKETGLHEYSCAIDGRLISLVQDSTHLRYRISSQIEPGQEKFEAQETQRFIKHYLNLEPNLQELYAEWSEKDKNFAKRAPNFHGVRILKQDAWEALVGFICSSCNNIKRITQMMDKLCARYGPLIGHINDQPFYGMPSPAALVNPRVESELRELGFGYRAAYLHQTAQIVAKEREGWLDSLRNPENPVFGGRPMPAGPMLPEGREGYRTAHAALVELQGVGAKVADCVCLFGLGWGEAVPVDTHVWQIAQRDYGFGRGKHKSLTKATYDAVANHFRSLWGKEAGWAHSVLFTADLRDFADRLLPESIKPEHMDVVKTEMDTDPTLQTDESGVSNINSANLIRNSRSTRVELVSIKSEVKEETADEDTILGSDKAGNVVLKAEEINTEVEVAHGVDGNIASFVKTEEKNTILPEHESAVAARSQSRKRKMTGHQAQKKVEESQQDVKPLIKRRRSDRLR